MSKPTARIERLRQANLERTSFTDDESHLLWARSWLSSASEPWYIIRRGKATADTLKNMTPIIDEDELIVGKFSCRELSEGEQAELEKWKSMGEPALPKALGQKAHMAIDYEKLLRLGIRGIRAQIEGFQRKLDLSLPDDMEKDAFYKACLIALEGVVALSEKYAQLAEGLAGKADCPERRAELLEIARICRKVPLEPASTFHEAVQAVHFITFCLCAGQRTFLFQLGRPDRYLLPFYERDLASGAIAVDTAQELIDCLCIMLNEYTPRGLAVGFMIGGRDSMGCDAANPLTYLFLESIAHTRLAYPGIGLCWHPDMPEDLLDRACELLSQGLTHPAVFNDVTITQGLLDAGLPPSEACLYVHSTCVEITPIASSNVYVASPYINLLQLLHDILGIKPKAREDEAFDWVALQMSSEDTQGLPESFDELLCSYRQRLALAVREAVRQQNICQASRRYHGGFPLLSCFVNDCLAQGKDIDHGGARHNWIEPSFVGLANVVDSLAAIRKLVFEEKKLELEGLIQAVQTDFQGQEALRQMLLHKAPKYANDDDAADELAVMITDWIAEECSRHRTYLGGSFHPGLFCWVMHERLGREMGASADGRPAGFPLADGAGGAQGRELLGPTAVVNSVTKWNHSPMLGGIAVNFKFTPDGRHNNLTAVIKHMIQTYMKLGGFEAQVNVVNRNTLLAAQENPEQYKDLVVRVAGYSDYFTGLTREMQNEIILRTEH
ncbi:MAG: hypothetical protein GX341_10205 [Firmicutes bacterium]|nr:hypothetical protein [Bacillota bacterium]